MSKGKLAGQDPASWGTWATLRPIRITYTSFQFFVRCAIWSFLLVSPPLAILLGIQGLSLAGGLAVGVAMCSQIAKSLLANAARFPASLYLSIGAALLIGFVGLPNALLVDHGLIVGLAIILLLFVWSIARDRSETVHVNSFTIVISTLCAWLGALYAWPSLGALDSLQPKTLLYGDYSFHESISISINLVGITDTSFFPGRSLRYHWLSNSWSNALSELSDIPLSDINAVAVPLFGIGFAVIGAIALASAIRSNVRSAELFAGLSIAAFSLPMVPASQAKTFVFAEFSASNATATVIGLPLVALAVLVLVHDIRTWSSALVLIILSFILPIARVPWAFVAVISLGAVTSYIAVRDLVLRPVLLLLGLILSPMVISFVLFVYGAKSNSFVFSLNDRVATGMALVSALGFADVVVGNVLLFGVLLWPLVAGLALIAIGETSKMRIGLFLGFGAVVGGFVAAAFLDQAGNSQVTFVWASLCIVLPVAGAGLSGIFRSLGLREYLLLIFTFTATLFLSLMASFQPDWTILNQLRLAFLVFPLIVFAAYPLITARGASSRQRSLTSACVVSVSGLAAAGLAGLAWSLANPTHYAVSDPNWSSKVLAGRWIDQNVSKDALFATNKQCMEQTPHSVCYSTKFDVSSLSGRRVLIEGVGFSDWPPSSIGAERQTISRNLSADDLRNAGVTWIWYDLSAVDQPRLPPDAKLRFSNYPITIHEIPSKKRDH